MVRRNELENWLNSYLQVDTISDFIPNGLQIEGAEEIDNIITAVSINLEVIETAVEAGAAAIIVHHGLFWKNDEPTIRGYRRKRFQLLLNHDINLFNYHLPLDIHPEVGHNRLILEGLGAQVQKGMEGQLATGLTGAFKKPVKFTELVDRVNRLLNTEAHYFHFGRDLIESLYVISGGGRNELEQVAGMEVDAFLTGDAKENTRYIAEETGINYIYAGHYNTERLGIIELGRQIKKQYEVKVKFVDVANPL